MIERKQGKSFYLDVEVLNKDRSKTNLVNAMTDFSYRSPGGDIVHKPCEVNDNVVTASLTPTETSTMLGIYDIEIAIKDAYSDIDEVISEKLKIKRSLNPTFGIEE